MTEKEQVEDKRYLEKEEEEEEEEEECSNKLIAWTA